MTPTAWSDLDALIGKMINYHATPPPVNVEGVVKEWKFTHTKMKVPGGTEHPGVKFLIAPVEGGPWVWTVTYAYTPIRHGPEGGKPHE